MAYRLNLTQPTKFYHRDRPEIFDQRIPSIREEDILFSIRFYRLASEERRHTRRLDGQAARLAPEPELDNNLSDAKKSCVLAIRESGIISKSTPILGPWAKAIAEVKNGSHAVALRGDPLRCKHLLREMV
jgi:thioesterase domain-containing protein